LSSIRLHLKDKSKNDLPMLPPCRDTISKLDRTDSIRERLHRITDFSDFPN
jgi:hypothetical protein